MAGQVYGIAIGREGPCPQELDEGQEAAQQVVEDDKLGLKSRSNHSMGGVNVGGV